MFLFLSGILTTLVTELTANPYAAQYVGRNHSDSYFIHNQQLMFHQRQQEIEMLDLED